MGFLVDMWGAHVRFLGRPGPAPVHGHLDMSCQEASTGATPSTIILKKMKKKRKISKRVTMSMGEKLENLGQDISKVILSFLTEFDLVGVELGLEDELIGKLAKERLDKLLTIVKKTVISSKWDRYPNQDSNNFINTEDF